MKLTIGKRLTLITILFSLAAIVPFFIVGLVSVSTARKSFIHDKFEQLESIRGIKKAQIEKFFQDRKSDMSVLVETVGTLRHEAFQKLTAVRDVKRDAVERYFQNINHQIITFSQDKMIVDAMKQFRSEFRNVRTDNALTPDALNSMRNELRTYYQKEFSEEYRKQNGSETVDMDQYFNQLSDDAIALQYYYIRANQNELGQKHLMDRADDTSRYSRLHKELHPILRSYLENFAFYDIFLVDADTGNIVYTVFKELDYSTSLLTGPCAPLNIGEAFQKANEATDGNAVVNIDYGKYLPSYEAPASFIASPIFDGDQRIGVAIFQIPIDQINDIMGERAGLGKTGETYLVGPDGLMRSNSYLDPEHHSVVASFKNPEKGKVATEAFKRAISGQTGVDVIMDYNGNPVLSAYSPIQIGELTWALLAEIDVAEAFSPVDDDGEPFFTKYKELMGYYDLFLMNPDGYCFFTVEREADYQTNLVTGPYKDSGFGRLVRKVLNTKSFGLADFEPYPPSNDEPAAFIAQPVVNNGRVELVVGLQLSIEAINSIMQVREGLGKSGETYLIGPDYLMRSDSYLDPTHHSVKASFADPAKGSVNTDAAKAAISGDRTSQKIIIDYNGNPVLSAYTPIKIEDITWALLAEIDEVEVTSQSVAAQNLLNQVSLIGIISCIAIFLVILFNVFSTRNLVKTLNRIIEGISESADQVASAAEEISSASQSLAEGASENAAALEETSSSLDDMSCLTKTNADSTLQAKSLVNETKGTVAKAGTSMKEMAQSIDEIADSGQEIGKIIKTIDEIAFQTNLLALNAAVEAARAGEAGAGFAVVADEVRNLAQRAAEAARNTSSLIEGTIKKIEHGNRLVTNTDDAFTEVEANADQITELVGKIATDSREQSQKIDQISTAMGQMSQVTQSDATNAEQTASASEELNAQADYMRESVAELAKMVIGDKVRPPKRTSGPRPKKGVLPVRRIGYTKVKGQSFPTGKTD